MLPLCNCIIVDIVCVFFHLFFVVHLLVSNCSFFKKKISRFLFKYKIKSKFNLWTSSNRSRVTAFWKTIHRLLYVNTQQQFYIKTIVWREKKKHTKEMKTIFSPVFSAIWNISIELQNMHIAFMLFTKWIIPFDSKNVTASISML